MRALASFCITILCYIILSVNFNRFDPQHKNMCIMMYVRRQTLFQLITDYTYIYSYSKSRDIMKFSQCRITSFDFSVIFLHTI